MGYLVSSRGRRNDGPAQTCYHRLRWGNLRRLGRIAPQLGTTEKINFATNAGMSLGMLMPNPPPVSEAGVMYTDPLRPGRYLEPILRAPAQVGENGRY